MHLRLPVASAACPAAVTRRPTQPGTARPRPSALLLAAAALTATACGADPGPGLPTPPPPGPGIPDAFELGPEVPCADPADPAAGIARLEDVAAARGLDFVVPDVDGPVLCPFVRGSVVASDLDGDGDDDLMFAQGAGFPRVWLNDGAGTFTEGDATAAGGVDGRTVHTAAAADADGDGLPEVFLGGPGFVLVFANEGDLQFGPAQPLVDEEGWPRACVQALALGDLDGDGALDLAVPRLERVGPEGWEPGIDVVPQGSDDLLLLGDGAGGFEAPRVLPSAGGPGMSILAAFTDRDLDGDVDLYLGSDRADIFPVPGASMFRNDGDPHALVDEAPALGLASIVSAMGVGSTDFNDDGLLDYCVSDVHSALACFVSDPGSGTYVEAGLAMGLAPDLSQWGEETDQWTSWSVALEDFDDDGVLDMAAAAGPVPVRHDAPEAALVPRNHPDAIWQGDPDAVAGGPGGAVFVERTADLGFGSPDPHFGLAAADFDGDGALELAVGTGAGAPSLWAGRCTANAWLTIDFAGPPFNRDGLSAVVAVEASGTTTIRELHGPLGPGQSSTELHFGVGDADAADRVTVTWPDGLVAIAEDVPVRRRVLVRHPAAAAR